MSACCKGSCSRSWCTCLHTATKELLSLKHMPPAAMVPLPVRPFKTWLVVCALHTTPPQLPAPIITLKLNSIPESVLLDSGSTITLACLLALLWTTQACRSLAVTCVHRDVRGVPTAEVQIGGQRGEWPVMFGQIPDLLVPLLVGRD